MLTIRQNILLVLTLLMVGCGWHLKGQVELPVGLRILHLETSLVSLDTQKLLKQALLSNGVTLAQDAPYTLKILQDHAQRRTLAVTSGARASEFELIQTLKFVLLDDTGAAQGVPMTVTTYRTQLYDNDAIIGEAQEEQTLRRRMKRDNASKLLQRLKAVVLTASESPHAP
ncbi:MAG: hypothetical protein RPR40_10970 [Bermanella sp.]